MEPPRSKIGIKKTKGKIKKKVVYKGRSIKNGKKIKRNNEIKGEGRKGTKQKMKRCVTFKN